MNIQLHTLSLALGFLLAQTALTAHAAEPRATLASTQADVAKIYGRIQFVTSFPDYRVQVVSSFADLHVKNVMSFADSPGKWQIVTSFPDFKIQLVESFPDFTISYVESFPGPR